MSASRRQTVLATAALVAGTLLMTACQDSDSDSGAAQSASSNPPGAGGQTPAAPAAPDTANPGGGKESTGQSSGGSQGGTSAGTGTASGGGGKSAKCRTDQLKTTAIDNTISGDPDGSVAVTFTNNGADCSMSGYAGVNLKTDAVEISAERTGQEPVSIILKSGKSVSFGINYPVETMGDATGPRITGLVVTPPDETKSITVNWPGAARLPVKSGPALKVGPIGSAGQGD